MSSTFESLNRRHATLRLVYSVKKKNFSKNAGMTSKKLKCIQCWKIGFPEDEIFQKNGKFVKQD